MRPRLLRPDNLTPPSRTPWGGRKLLDRYKRYLDLGAAAALPLVGESWEISVEPSFPSRLADEGVLLADAIAQAPEAWLGAATARRYGGQTPLLVKLLDAADNLSVQVHPASGDPTLAAGESGKPEGWYVLDAEPGAGLYLGFREGVKRGDVECCLRSGERLDTLMNFVPVRHGDAFIIPAGTVHAVGAGVTLVEPQLVLPGRRGLTYRYWDWNRRYDQHGNLSPEGMPRELHIERSLAVTEWDAPRGSAAVNACRARPSALPSHGTPAGSSSALEGTQLIDWEHFVLERWAGSGALSMAAPGTMLAVVCTAGSADIATDAGATRIAMGQSLVIPAAASTIEITGTQVELLATRLV